MIKLCFVQEGGMKGILCTFYDERRRERGKDMTGPPDWSSKRTLEESGDDVGMKAVIDRPTCI